MMTCRSPRAVRLSPTDLCDSWRAYSPVRAALVSSHGIPYPVHLLTDDAAAARGRLVQHYYYLVGNTRIRIVPAVPVKVSELDLEQAGTVGLIRALDRYDPERRVRFESYAIACIRGAMLEYLRQDDWAPRSVRTQERRLAKARETLRDAGEDEESVSALARALGISEEEVYIVLAEATVLHTVSLDDATRQIDDAGDEIRYADTSSVAVIGPTMDEHLLDAVRQDALIGAIGYLPSLWRKVLILYFFKGESRRKIAGTLGRSEALIGEILTQATEELRLRLAQDLGLFEGNTLD